MNLTRFWDWVDKRQIDKHTVSLIVLYGTKSVTDWAESFASSHPDQSGALVIAAVCIPYMALQAAAIKYYFDRGTNA